jgi:hypothetical protein
MFFLRRTGVNTMELTSIEEKHKTTKEDIAYFVNLGNDAPIFNPVSDYRMPDLLPLFNDNNLLQKVIKNGLVFCSNNLFHETMDWQVNSLHANIFNFPEEHDPYVQAVKMATALKVGRLFSTVARVADPSYVTSLLLMVKKSENWLGDDIHDLLITSLLMPNTRAVLNILDNQRFTGEASSQLKKSVIMPTLLELCYDVVLKNKSVQMSSDVAHYISENIVDAMWNTRKSKISLFPLLHKASVVYGFIDTKIRYDKELLKERVGITEHEELMAFFCIRFFCMILFVRV